MANLSLLAGVEGTPARAPVVLSPGELDCGEALSTPSLAETMLVASFGDPAAADYAVHVSGCRVRLVDLSQPGAADDLCAALGFAKVSSCILFLKPRWTKVERQALDALLPLLAETAFVAIVSTFGIHLGDVQALAAETEVLRRLNGLAARVVVFRAGHVVSEYSRIGRRLRRLGFAFPLVPRHLRSCFVGAGELFAAIDRERQAARSRTYITLLGPNRPWRDVLREQRCRGVWPACLTGVAFLLAILLVGRLAALIFRLLLYRRPSWRTWNFDTLRPRSFAELLSLCNRHNNAFVKVVGYNNGVIHFGQRHPGKTILSTVRCNRIVRMGPDLLRVDCGATIRDATTFLAAAGQELHVLPNYSYVCLGTAFFVPIHGSAADYSTVADTIVRALLYDPARDRFLVAAREDAAFRDNVYNLAAGILVLRLWLRVKPRARYFVRHEERTDPSGEELLDALRDPGATNVEIRKSRAASSLVRISSYQTASAQDEPGLEFPRDSLGRLWDRLEENRLTSFLMHAATRYFAWHVELFFRPEEFVRFWESHKALPLRKIQLRYIRRDGLPHSAFRDHDCVAVDLFMFRWKRRKLENYLKKAFAVIRTNPGKHSQ
jgi:hypothetical protein